MQISLGPAAEKALPPIVFSLGLVTLSRRWFHNLSTLLVVSRIRRSAEYKGANP